uniref:hypothetical protein n=1 Tax=Actinoplanes sp. CA-151224 TaxID=3239904 RepID=UPI003F499A9E
MERWRLTYVIPDGSSMFGLDVAPEHTVDVDIASETMEENAILDEMRARVHAEAGQHVILTDAEKISVPAA